MRHIGKWIAEVIGEVSRYHLPTNKEARRAFLTKTQKALARNRKLLSIADHVKMLTRRFPLP